MRSLTLNFIVQGDSYDDLQEKADAVIAKFLGVEDDEDDFFPDETASMLQQVNYELVVTQNTELTSEFEYTAQVIAKVKNVRAD
jgi:hypothetical protein